MRIDITSMFFNSSIEGKTATPAWGTSIGQKKSDKCRIYDDRQDVLNILVGLTYKSVPIDGKINASKGSKTSEFILAAVFDDIYINNKKINNSQFVLMLVREHSDSHDGRLLFKYAPYFSYNDISNEICISKMAKALGCTENGAWFVHDIEIINQSELHFHAMVLDKDNKKEYPSSYSSRNRSDEWKAMIPVSDSVTGIKTNSVRNISNLNLISQYRTYITAIKSKPFLLLAGISGTGKSRIVRELARACWDKESEEFNSQSPSNFEMIQVKPNWHDSSELLGYVSRVSGKPVFVQGRFIEFIIKAWKNQDKPYFLCLDEMNLAPVEQYFAEYLSVIESRKKSGREVVTDAIIKAVPDKWYTEFVDKMVSPKEYSDINELFLSDGITLPENLIVIGTVNMDETTFSFSRKVLDRAMTIEMNKVTLSAGLTEEHENIGLLNYDDLVGLNVEGKDVYLDNKEVCDEAIKYLGKVNKVLEQTPFKIAYRTRNEFLLYVVNNLPYTKEKDKDLSAEFVFARALDEITNMKILSRIEGDSTKVTEGKLKELIQTITAGLLEIDNNFDVKESISIAKLNEMLERLKSGYTSFWS